MKSILLSFREHTDGNVAIHAEEADIHGEPPPTPAEEARAAELIAALRYVMQASGAVRLNAQGEVIQ